MILRFFFILKKFHALNWNYSYISGLWDTDPATSVGVDPTVQTDYDDLNSIVNNR